MVCYHSDDMDAYLLRGFGYSLHVVILYYGVLAILGELSFTIVPCGLLIIVATIALVYYFRVPPPSQEVVEKILGKDRLNNSEENASGKPLLKIGHRGAALDVPENTLAAFRYCKDKGCDFIELDISITADNVPIVFHDSTTGRVANQDLVVSDTDWAVLKDLDLSVKHKNGDRFPQTRIPTVEEAVTHLLANKQKMLIDIKRRDPKLIEVVLDLYEKHPELYENAIVTSFFATIIYRIRRNNPRIVGAVSWCSNLIFLATRESNPTIAIWKASILHLLDVLYEWLLPRFSYFFAGFSVLLLHRFSVNVKTIWDWRKMRHIRVIGWTINRFREKQFYEEILKIPYLTDTLEDTDPIDPLAQFD